MSNRVEESTDAFLAAMQQIATSRTPCTQQGNVNIEEIHAARETIVPANDSMESQTLTREPSSIHSKSRQESPVSIPSTGGE